ncbi:hypothetical protein N7326_03860 [Corynebacterium sp. ES2794-CONJ1]|nr:hypothetical protein [Corynebacterium sp. ES2794-CONJ1]MCU9519008.1 hypothetical protein [Corynebacterium sp. ES2794-CONJ1]
MTTPDYSGLAALLPQIIRVLQSYYGFYVSSRPDSRGLSLATLLDDTA